jgi:hypothetical protein
MPNYPEHEKLKAIKDKSQAVGEFLEWLGAEGIHLAKYHEHSDDCRRGCCDEGLYPHHESIINILARHFEIDNNKIETEKRKMLQNLRDENRKK